jgi:hypothetical protein
VGADEPRGRKRIHRSTRLALSFRAETPHHGLLGQCRIGDDSAQMGQRGVVWRRCELGDLAGRSCAGDWAAPRLGSKGMPNHPRTQWSMVTSVSGSASSWRDDAAAACGGAEPMARECLRPAIADGTGLACYTL